MRVSCTTVQRAGAMCECRVTELHPLDNVLVAWMQGYEAGHCEELQASVTRTSGATAAPLNEVAGQVKVHLDRT